MRTLSPSSKLPCNRAATSTLDTGRRHHSTSTTSVAIELLVYQQHYFTPPLSAFNISRRNFLFSDAGRQGHFISRWDHFRFQNPMSLTIENQRHCSNTTDFTFTDNCRGQIDLPMRRLSLKPCLFHSNRVQRRGPFLRRQDPYVCQQRTARSKTELCYNTMSSDIIGERTSTASYSIYATKHDNVGPKPPKVKTLSSNSIHYFATLGFFICIYWKAIHYFIFSQLGNDYGFITTPSRSRYWRLS